jgi:glucuronoarabinoxylan endo-1,4-beta-xylanase
MRQIPGILPVITSSADCRAHKEKGRTMKSPIRLAIAAGACLAALHAVPRAAVIAIDASKQYQTILGLGGHDPMSSVSDCVTDLGITAATVRINPDDSAFEPNTATLKAMLNAGVRIFTLSPWSPPAYMKYNNDVQGTDAVWNRLSNGMGPCCSYLTPTASGERGAMRNYYPDYAAYLVRLLKKFKQDVGIDAYAISPQNEPAFAEPYGSCVYSPGQMRDIVWELGKAMAAEGLLDKTRISVAEDMLGSFGPEVTLSLRDTAVVKYVGAIGVHGYSSNGVTPGSNAAGIWKSVASYCETSNPAKRAFPLWQTEISGYMNWTGGTGGDGVQVPGAAELGAGMYQALKYGHISLWLWWRLVTVSAGWIDESLVCNGVKLKTYYVSKNFFRFIRPGAVMIDCSESTDTTLGAIAFNDKTAKTLTIVAINNSAASKTISFAGADLPAALDMYVTSASKDCEKQAATVAPSSVAMPASSIVTLVGNNYQPPIVKVNPPARPAGMSAPLSGKRTAVYCSLQGRTVAGLTGTTAGATGKALARVVLVRESGRVVLTLQQTTR